MLSNSGVGQEGGPAVFAFSYVANSKDQGRGVEGKKLASCLKAHASASASDDDSLAIEVEARGQRRDFGLGEDTHSADKGCQINCCDSVSGK